MLIFTDEVECDVALLQACEVMFGFSFYEIGMQHSLENKMNITWSNRNMVNTTEIQANISVGQQDRRSIRKNHGSLCQAIKMKKESINLNK